MSDDRMSPLEEAAFVERVLRWQDGGLAAEDQKAFEQELAASAEKRRVFLEAHLQGASVREHLRARAYRAPGTGLAPAGLEGPRWRQAVPWMLAACATLGLVWLITRRAPEVAAAVPRMWIATLVGQEDCPWADGAERFVGQRLAAETLRLHRGTAAVRFDAGARMLLAGPAELVLESAGSARLRSGQVSVQAPEEAVGFRLRTRDGTAVDLGAEFIVSVDRGGGTTCEVVEGEVEWHAPDGSRRVALLSQGEARRFDGDRMENVAARETAGWRKLFEAASPAAPPGALLAYEPFDYGWEEAAAESHDGGFGWRSPWRGRFIPTDEVDVDPRIRLRPGASLDFQRLAASQGGSFVFHEPKQWRLRTLPAPVDFRQDGVFYLSFLARRPLQPPPLTPEKARYGRMMVTFRSSTDYWAHWVGFAISSASQPLILADGNNRGSDRVLPLDQTVLIVCKMAASRRGPDQLFLKVYEPGEAVELEDTPRWTVVSEPLNYDAAFDLIILGLTGGVAWELDELRYGTSWSAVLPPAGPR